MPPAIVPAGSAVPMPRATAGCRTVGTFRAATRFPSEAPIRRIVGAPPPLQLRTRQSRLHVPKRIHRTSGPNTEPAGIRRPAACLGGPASRAAHATSGHHALRAGSDEPRRGRDGPSTVSLPPCSRFPTVATYSPNRRTTETRHMNRTRPSGIRLCERHTRNAPPVPFRAEAGATRAPQDTIPYMTLHAKPTSVLPTSIAVSTAVQYGQPLTGNYSIEITTAKAALAERLLTILVSAA